MVKYFIVEYIVAGLLTTESFPRELREKYKYKFQRQLTISGIVSRRRFRLPFFNIKISMSLDGNFKIERFESKWYSS